jgi:hypothetical protein
MFPEGDFFYFYRRVIKTSGVNMGTYLTPEQAKNLLTDLQPGAKIEIEITPTGEIVVSSNGNDSLKTKQDILEENYADLIGQPITISKASKGYEVPNSTLRDWIKQKYISIVDDGYPVKINEAEVAYCAEVYHQRKKAGTLKGAPLFDLNGLPYKLIHPSLSEYRRKRRSITK